MHGSNIGVKSVIKAVANALEEGRFAACVSLLEAEIANHNENALIDLLLKSTLFWHKRVKNLERNTTGPTARAHYLLSEWEKYRNFLSDDVSRSPDFDQYLFLFQKTISKMALSLLHQALHDPLVNEPQTHLYIARCCRMAGDYEQAIAEYRRVIRQDEQCTPAYAELGDCYLLIGNEHIGRLFLREAFCIDPHGIEFNFLESELIANLIARLREIDGIAHEWAAWVGVYAVLWDVFTVKRDLKTAEYGMLRQRIYALEREYSETAATKLEPVLLYAYFYLLDYYYKSNRMALNIEEVLMKIKGINPNIYNLYINRRGKRSNEEAMIKKEVSDE